MMKLTRARKCDPALAHDDTRDWQGRDQPRLDEKFFTLDADAIIAQRLPMYDARRSMLARNPLACVE
eukprot:520142-Amphidinium_carterae.1